MSTTARFDPADVLAYSSEPVVDLSDRLARTSLASVPPLSMPRSQAYYWGYLWQSGESESLAAIEDGRGVRFSSGADLANWLLSDDSDDDAPA
jgi:hypothetical protein